MIWQMVQFSKHMMQTCWIVLIENLSGKTTTECTCCNTWKHKLLTINEMLMLTQKLQFFLVKIHEQMPILTQKLQFFSANNTWTDAVADPKIRIFVLEHRNEITTEYKLMASTVWLQDCSDQVSPSINRTTCIHTGEQKRSNIRSHQLQPVY